MLKRVLDLNLPKGQSIFIWGARKTGKSTYLKKHFSQAFFIDFLHHQTYLRYSRAPSILREEIEALKGQKNLVIIDEVQKVPEILDEVHWLIEDNKELSFILCGSSLRKLKRSGSNLLGGRAWRQNFLPLCFPELPEFNLHKILNHGLIPSHYLSEEVPIRQIEGYVVDYMIPEVQMEGRIRNLGAFNRFLEVIAFSNGEQLNYSNIARECSVNIKTAQGYVELLCDMLLGYLILPYSGKSSRQTIMSAPKFYFFDTALPLFLKEEEIKNIKGPSAGHAFEHYLFLELLAYRETTKKRYNISYWRTKTGLEVDFVVGKGNVAIEVKISHLISKYDLKGLFAFTKDNSFCNPIVVCLEPNKRIMHFEDVEVQIYPVQQFLTELWKGKII